MNSIPVNKNEDYLRIVQAICEELKELKEVASEPGQFSETTDLTMDVQIDSASTMILVFSLEEKFDVSVPLNELGNARTIGDLANLILTLKVKADASSASC